MTSASPHQIHLTTARTLAKLMDNQFSVFGVRFGFDSILGLLPGIGDVISMGFSGYIIWIALELKLPLPKIWQMLRNILLDLVIGSIPLIGDIADVFSRCDTKNLAILETFVQQLDSVDNVIEGKVL